MRGANDVAYDDRALLQRIIACHPDLEENYSHVYKELHFIHGCMYFTFFSLGAILY